MKIIITEEQLKLIVENEGEDNLINFTLFYNSGIPPVEWDGMYEHMNKKKGGKYDGYYINGDIDKFGNKSVDLRNQEINNLDYLVRVNGSLELSRTNIKSLERLEFVNGYLNLSRTNIKSLERLEVVNGYLDLYGTKISSLPSMKSIGGSLSIGGDTDKSMPPISKKQDWELKKMFEIKGKIMI